jgi:hypothetical protein
VSATVGGGHDVIDPPGTLGPETLNVVLGSLSVSQIVSEHGVVGLSYDLVHLDGFQSNIYRNVRIGAGADIAHETHPDTRTRHAVAASLKWFFPRLDATVIGQYRFYADDWDLHAHTPELRATKNVGDWIVVGARYRYHRQDAADFYRDEYDVMQTYVTADPKLAAFDSHLIGARFELTAGALGVVERLEQARIELVGEYIVQHNAFGDAIVSYASLVLPFEY